MDLLLHAGHGDPRSIRPMPADQQWVRREPSMRDPARHGPFWFAVVGSAVILALIWRELAHIAHAGRKAIAG
jgi:hypothetical protein